MKTAHKVALAATGGVGAVAATAAALGNMSQTAQDDEALLSTESLEEESSTAEETVDSTEQQEEVSTPVITPVSNEGNNRGYPTYTSDRAYMNSLGSSSMGWKFQDSVILAPKGDQAWEDKAQRVKEKAKKTGWGDKSKGLGRYKNWLYNAWNRENIDMDTMDGNKIHSLCTDILSYNDYGIWFTEISRLNYKWFFDFVWEVCGREDKPKPGSWRYAHQ